MVELAHNFVNGFRRFISSRLYLPIRKRAAYSIGIFLANTVIIQLIMYGIVIRMAAFFRPILSAKMPEGTAPTIAPIANSDAIHVFSSTLVGIMESEAAS